jgi:hypothetical protein
MQSRCSEWTIYTLIPSKSRMSRPYTVITYHERLVSQSWVTLHLIELTIPYRTNSRTRWQDKVYNRERLTDENSSRRCVSGFIRLVSIFSQDCRQQNPHPGLLPEHQNSARCHRFSHSGISSWKGICSLAYDWCQAKAASHVMTFAIQKKVMIEHG